MVATTARTFMSKLLYGALFAVLLPLGLIFWVLKLDRIIDLTVPRWGIAAAVAIAIGTVLMVSAIFGLARWGKGLPMNAFPPKAFVRRGVYRWFSHPIYLGAALLSLGTSLWFRSPGGVYIVTPVLILAMISLVWGYERLAMLKIFGDTVRQHRPILAFPASGKRRWLTIAALVFLLAAGYLSTLLFLFGFRLANNVIPYVLVYVAVLLLALGYRVIWGSLKRFSEWVANSRHDWLFFQGRFRIINHSIYSGLAGATGVGIFGYVTGSGLAALIVILCALAGAASFAQFRWGSASLLRPFGYWGGITGGVLGILLVRVLFGISVYQAAVAGVLCAPFAQAIGRLRCLSQGCCHGIVTSPDMGIRVWQSQSRVVVLSGLKGEYILPTQMFSIIFNLMLGTLLVSIWSSGMSYPSLTVGLYFALTGIERFTEDAYRGEKQTKISFGLRENQWIAIAALLVGIAVTVMPFPQSTKATGDLSLALLWTALPGGLISAFAMSMDFPKSNVKFSRLSG